MINYRRIGDPNSQKAIVLIHGLATDGTIFEKIVESYFANHYLVIIPHLRGCGLSSSTNGEYTINESAKDIVDIINQVGKERYVLLGYSQGGAIAQQIAKSHPQLVSGLILVNSFANNTRIFQEKIESYILKQIVRILPLKATARLLKSQLIKEGVTDKDDLNSFEKSILKCDKQAILSFVNELRSFDSSTWLKEIKCFTLIIRGEEDNAVPAHHARELNQLLSNSKLEVIAGAGHALLWTHVKALVDIIKKYEEFLPY